MFCNLLANHRNELSLACMAVAVLPTIAVPGRVDLRQDGHNILALTRTLGLLTLLLRIRAGQAYSIIFVCSPK